MPRFSNAIPLLAIVLASACGGIDAPGYRGDVQLLLTRGETYASYLTSRPGTLLTDPEVLSLGYLERARLGLGSPFRLVEFALRDPGLDDDRRVVLAYAILAQTRRGDVYRVEPEVLARVRLSGTPAHRELADRQLRVIEQTVAAAPTAGSGERAVRIGYALASAERTVIDAPYSVVAHAAALIADRRRAREDVSELLRATAQSGGDPLDLLVRWRRELRFQVERPALTPSTAREEEWEASDAPQVALALRTLAHRHRGVSLAARRDAGGDESFLDIEAARRLAALAEARDYPAQAPIAVALAINSGLLTGAPGLDSLQTARRGEFLDSGWNEERLVSGARRLAAADPASERALRLVQLQAATFLRVWNQEEPWFPGDPAPAAKELTARFGLAGVDFDGSVPDAWRPYYLRMLGRGLSDLQRVLPTAPSRGLRIRFGPLPTEIHALALHDPRTRTLVLPTRTASGTLAHEIAHDLDWQLARVRYGTRGGYATDLAVRSGRQDRIASSLSGLAASLTRPHGDTLLRAHDTRPAEVFARGADWLVAASLAREGRMGGYLTSFQDAALTGYGTTRGPDVGGAAVPNLLTLLDGIAPVLEAPRRWALDHHGPNRILTPAELAGAILATGIRKPADERMGLLANARDRSLASLSSSACRTGSAERLRRLAGAQRELIVEATAAALRGAVVDGVHALARDAPAPADRRRVDEWLAWKLYGAPEPVDSAVSVLAPAFEDILLRASTIAAERPVELPSVFAPGPAVPLCGSNPFAAPAAPRAGGSAGRAVRVSPLAAVRRAPRPEPLTFFLAAPEP